MEKISITDFETRYKIEFKDHFSHAWKKLEKFKKEGLVNLSLEKIELTPVGILFTRNLAMPFDRYLEESVYQHFSKTV